MDTPSTADVYCSPEEVKATLRQQIQAPPRPRPSAVEEVFNIFELHEMILLALPPSEVLLAAAILKLSRNIVEKSKAIQAHLSKASSWPQTYVKSDSNNDWFAVSFYGRYHDYNNQVSWGGKLMVQRHGAVEIFAWVPVVAWEPLVIMDDVPSFVTRPPWDLKDSWHVHVPRRERVCLISRESPLYRNMSVYHNEDVPIERRDGLAESV